MYIVTCGDIFQKPHFLINFTMYHSLMITKKLFDFIVSQTSIRYLQFSKVKTQTLYKDEIFSFE